MQKLHPDKYADAALTLPDTWIEDTMQHVAEVPWLLAQLADCADVIELGWGSGIVARALGAAGKHVRMVDGAKAACAEAQACAGVYPVRALFEDYEPPIPVDCVIASFVLEHVADPVALLKRARSWAPRLIAVIGNAESWHRRLAVQMQLQPRLDTLSPRDHAVGHYCVYDRHSIAAQLGDAGWRIKTMHGMQFKPLPNAMMQHFDERLLRAMCEVAVRPEDAANIGIVCERV